MVSPLRLRAVDTIDLAVIAAHLQDAVAQVGDMAYQPRERRFAVMFNRFMWEDVQDADGAGAKADAHAPYRRVRAVLHFDGVLKVKSQGLRLDRKEAVANILTLAFEPSDDVAGSITMTFAGGGAIKLEVECLDAWLSDVSEPWSTKNLPSHGTDADEPLG
jgi:DUF2948 family protein